MAETFDRTTERQTNMKAFAINEGQLMGASRVEAYRKNPKYEQSLELQKMCSMYAIAYAETMVGRLLAEEPEYFDEREQSREALVTNLTNNICLPVHKQHARVFRETTADMIEKQHTTDTIRRLNNGGDKFHPYF